MNDKVYVTNNLFEFGSA